MGAVVEALNIALHRVAEGKEVRILYGFLQSLD